MFLFDLFRSFLPLHNPLGFGVSDFLLLALAMLLAVCAIGFARLQPLALRLASHTRWSMLVAAALPVLLRLSYVGQGRTLSLYTIYHNYGSRKKSKENAKKCLTFRYTLWYTT